MMWKHNRSTHDVQKSKAVLCPRNPPKFQSKIGPEAIPEEFPIIPGLPNDLARLCLACVPRSDYGPLKRVCKGWRAALYSKSLFDLRKKWGKLEEFLCLFRDDPSVVPGDIFDPRKESWSKIPRMPGKRDENSLHNFVCVAVEGHLYVIGGTVLDTGIFQLSKPLYSSAVFRYDPVSSRWEQRSSMSRARGWFACGVRSDNTVVVAGGEPRANTLSSVERYDVEKDRWFKEDDLPSMRVGCVGFVFHDEFWVMDDYSGKGEILCTNSGKWRKLPPMWKEGKLQRFGRVAVMQGKNGESIGIFLLKGIKIYRYDIASNRWQVQSSLPTMVPENVCGIVALNQELYVISGSSPKDLERGRRPKPKWASQVLLQVYNPKEQTWRKVLTEPPRRKQEQPIKNEPRFPCRAMCSIRL